MYEFYHTPPSNSYQAIISCWPPNMPNANSMDSIVPRKQATHVYSNVLYFQCSKDLQD